MLARDVMRTKVIALRPSDTLAAAARALVEHGVSGAPVVEGEKVVGILSESDILGHLRKLARLHIAPRYMAKEGQALFIFTYLAERGRPEAKETMEQLRKSLVRDAMTTPVTTAGPTDTIEYVAAIMIKKDINRVPIVEHGKLRGIVTRHDLVRIVGQNS